MYFPTFIRIISWAAFGSGLRVSRRELFGDASDKSGWTTCSPKAVDQPGKTAAVEVPVA